MRQKTASRIRDNRYILLAFLVSAAIVTIAYGVRRIYPFGDQTVLRVDLYHQYAPYIEELHSRLLSGKSLLYSWEGGLGKDFVSQMAYYTASPFNVLMFFFPEKHLPELIALLILLKLSGCSASFAWYLKSRYGRNDLSLLIFGLLYGFCAFLTCYYWNIMWLDTVLLFPLVARGCERLAWEGRVTLYYGALTATMIVNFYLAVLVCVITALYFLAQLIIQKRYLFRAKPQTRLQRLCLRLIWRFALVSCLCAMTALFILAPVALALRETAVSDSAFPPFEIYTNVWQLLTNHFLGARAAVLARNEDLPNIYSGVLTMVLVPGWLSLRAVPKRKKAALCAIPVFMLLCACVKPLDYLIHGLHFPANLPHRFTFMYSFLLLVMAYEAWLHLQEVRFSWCVAGTMVYAASIFLTEFVAVKRVEDIDRVLSNGDIILNLVLLAGYLALLWLYQKREGRRALSLLTLLLVVGESLFSCITNLEDTGSRQAYIQYMDDAAEAVAYLDEREAGGFYRTEFRRFTTINDASLYHYNGFSQFSSLEPGGISDFISHLGIAATGNSFRYYDPSPLIDAMFDLKYVLNKDGPHPKAERYQLLEQFGSVWVYENPRNLSLGFLTSPGLLDLPVSGTQPFQVQNEFLQRAAGVQEELFTLIEPDNVETEFITTTALEGDSSFNYSVDQPGNLDNQPGVSAVYTCDSDQYVYLYVDAGNAQRFLYHNSTVSEDRELSAGRSLIDVGPMSAGEKLYVEFKLTRRGAFEKTYRESGTVSLYAAAYHDEVFQEGYERLAAGQYEITDFSDTRVEGTVNAAEESLLFTSIPYLPGWSCLVDQQEAEITPVGEKGVVAVRVPPGIHTVVFRYHQRVLLPAALGSVLGLVLFLLLRRRWYR